MKKILLIWIFVMFLPIAFAAQAPDGIDDVLIQYHLNTGSGTEAISTGSNTTSGTITNSSDWVEGLYSFGINTTNTDIQGISNNSNSYHIFAAWIKPDQELNPSAPTQSIYWCTDNTYSNCGTNNFGHYNSGSFVCATSGGSASYSFNLSANTWLHYLCVKNSTGHYLYINGSKVDEDLANPVGQNLNYFTVGGDWQSGGLADFNGVIDEVHLFEKEYITQSTIDTLSAPANITGNFTITAKSFFYNELIYAFNASINGTTYQSNISTGEIITPYFKNSSIIINISFTANQHVDTEYLNYNITNNLFAELNTTYYRLNITANAFNGTEISVFSANATNSSTFEGSTTNGVLFLNVTKDKTFNIVVDAIGYAFGELRKLVDDWIVNAELTLYATNSVNFTFKDINTLQIVDNVSVELISTIFANNYTTTNGILYLDLLSPATYTVRYQSSNYDQSLYVFTLTNRSTQNITLYLTNTTTSTTVTATVLDETNTEVEGAYIKVLKYDTPTNSYITQEIVATNFEGQAQFDVYLNTEFYKFIIEYPLGTIVKETTPSYIYSQTLEFQVILADLVGQNFFNSQDVDYYLVFNNDTNSFRFTYSDGNNVVSQGCLKVYIISSSREKLYNSTCVSSASSTILSPVGNTSGRTYRADAYINFGSDDYFLTSIYHDFITPQDFGRLGLFMITIFCILFASIAIWNKSLALILFPLPLLAGSGLQIIDLPFWIVFSIELIACIVAFMLTKR